MKKILFILCISFFINPLNIFAYDVEKRIKKWENECVKYDERIKTHKENIETILVSSIPEEDKYAKVIEQETQIKEDLTDKLYAKKIIFVLFKSQKPKEKCKIKKVKSEIEEIEKELEKYTK